MSGPDVRKDVDEAEAGLRRGELPHALYHASGAAASYPAYSPYVELLERVIDASDDPIELTKLGDKPWYGEVAAHAVALARKGRAAQGFHYLAQVALLRPGEHFLEWPQRWLRDPDVARQLGDPALVPSFAMVLGRFPPEKLDQDGLVTVGGLTDVLLAVDAAGHASPMHLAFLAMALRRMGRIDQSIKVAERAWDAAPSWVNAVAVANSERDNGNVDTALMWYRRAVALAPEQVSIHLDIADMLCDAGRYAEGLAHYDAVLAIEPQHPWGLPSRLYFAWFATMGRAGGGDDALRVELEAFARAHPDNERARRLSHALGERVAAWIGWVPEPREASLNVVKHLQKQWANKPPEPGQRIGIELSAPEAPSARMAVERTFLDEDWDVGIDWKIEAWPTPDPRNSITDRPLWRYDGEVPSPTVEPPNVVTAGQVADLAAQIFHLRAWWAEAERIGKLVGKENVADVIATMVHPPAPPPGAPQWIWIQRVQLAAAMIAANALPPLDAVGPLSDVLFGPSDWSVDAAAVALGVLAETHPTDLELCKTVDSAFAVRFQATPDRGYTSYLHPLVCTWLRVPHVDAADRERLAGWKTHLEQKV